MLTNGRGGDCVTASACLFIAWFAAENSSGLGRDIVVAYAFIVHVFLCLFCHSVLINSF